MNCSEGTDYVRIVKKTLSYGNEESFSITDGTNTLYSSPSLSSNEERELETCLTKTTNSQYELHVRDSVSDSWSDGAWIALYGVDGNIVFKNLMSERTSQIYTFSLYSPIHFRGEWKFSNAAGPNWTAYSFDDSAWNLIVLGSEGLSSTGTQYFRKTFVGLSGMAAVDVKMKYQYGIVAYVNGAEIYRDNMPSGEVVSSTLATGSYSAPELRGVLRPAIIAEAAQSVLAVEIHFSQADFQDSIPFDAYVAFLSSVSSGENKCFVVPYDLNASGQGFTSASSAFAWTRNSGASASALPASLTFSFTGTTTTYVNGFQFWTYASYDNGPSEFDIEMSATGTEWEILRGVSNSTFTYQKWDQFLVAAPYSGPFFRYTAKTVSSLPAAVGELQLLVCNMPSATTFSFPESSYSFYARYDAVSMRPTSYGLQNCQSTPSLPSGLTLGPDCRITGFAALAQSQVTYSLTAMAGSSTVTGSITLTFTECAGSLIRIVRSYGVSPSTEGFRIRDTSNDAILLEIPTGNTHPVSTEWTTYLCVTADRYDITLFGTTAFWTYNSYVYLYSLLPEGNEEMLLRARFDNNQKNDIVYYLRRHVIKDSEQWFYKMGEVPSNWYDSNTQGWTQGSFGSFPESTNRVQLYKKTFSVANLSEVKGLILSIRYRYGCVVYLNGNEAWRNGVTGDVSTTSVVDNSYPSLLYRIVTLPGKNAQTGVSYLVQGTNTIAIAILALNDETQKTSLFDATVRLMPDTPEAHIWEFTSQSTGMAGTSDGPFNGYYSSTIYAYSCRLNSLTLVLNNDRREWISSVQVQNNYLDNVNSPSNFQLYARNSADSEWTLLKNVTGLVFSMAGQKHRIFFNNQISYNQFRFENFSSGSSTACEWEVQSLNLYADNVFADLAPLTYPASSTLVKDIEIAEIIPEGNGYMNFRSNPALPSGILIDPNTGMLSGTPTVLSSATTYTITADKITGGSTTVPITLSVQECVGNFGMMTVRIYADGYASENSWNLYAGRTTSGVPIRSVARFPVASSYYYIDFCLENGLYTFQGSDSFGDGWAVGSGYTLTVDQGEMELEIEELRSGAKPTSVTTTFSTFIPFQIESTEWKVFQSATEAVPSDWKQDSFNDGAWETKKAADIPNPTSVTTYIRKSFELTNIDDYQVLNVRVKYAGGVVVYFNGNKVARFNLIEDFDASTESIAIHDSTIFSKFHIILPSSGVKEGTNVIAFEVHRPIGTSSADSFVFDATGVFGVMTCSAVVDTFERVSSSSLVSGTLENIMDLDPNTTGSLPNMEGTFLEWTVENLEGSRWNSFNIVGSNTVNNWGFYVYGSFNPDNPEAEQITVLHESSISVPDRVKPQIPAAVGMAGFRKFRWEVSNAGARSTNIGSIHAAYCKAEGAVCPGIDQYPSVSEGQISPAGCAEGYTGYSYRECANGSLGEVKMDHCMLKVPANPRYHSLRMVFVMGTAVSSGVPTVNNIVENWYIDEGVKLPDGLTLNAKTGELSGRPSELWSITSYRIYAENASGAASVAITIQVRLGSCKAEGVFPLTNVDEVATYACSIQGSYVGTQKRACVLGETDGVWQKASGFCVSILTIVVLVVVAIVVVAVVVLLLVRMGRKTKAVGGAKGKKNVAKTTQKKTVKTVKV